MKKHRLCAILLSLCLTLGTVTPALAREESVAIPVDVPVEASAETEADGEAIPVTDAAESKDEPADAKPEKIKETVSAESWNTPPTDDSVNLAEFGRIFGDNSWGDDPNTSFEKAFDGDPSTFFDCCIPIGGSVGVDMVFDSYSLSQVDIHPREGQEGRMEGLALQGSDDPDSYWNTIYEFPSGEYENRTYTIKTTDFNETAFGYHCYRLTNTVNHLDVGEVAFYGHLKEKGSWTSKYNHDDTSLNDVSTHFGGPSWEDKEEGKWENAFDDDINTFYDAAKPYLGDMCVGIDLGSEAYRLTQVDIFPRADNVERMHGVTIQGSVDGENWVNLYKFTEENFVLQTYTVTYDDFFMPYREYCFTQFRLCNPYNHFNVAEAAFYGDKNGETFKTQSWSSMSSSSDTSLLEVGEQFGSAPYSDNPDVSWDKLFDGNIYTYYDAAEGHTPDMYAGVHLWDEAYRLTQVDVFPVGEIPSRIGGLEIQASVEGTIWTTLYQFPMDVDYEHRMYTVTIDDFDPAYRDYRFNHFRLINVDGDHFNIAEAALYGDTVGEVCDNISWTVKLNPDDISLNEVGTLFGGPSWEDDPDVSWEKAFDNDINTFYDAAESKNPDMNVGVDFGSDTYRLKQVDIYPRDGQVNRMGGIQIQGSADGEVWVTLYEFPIEDDRYEMRTYTVTADDFNPEFRDYKFSQFRLCNLKGDHFNVAEAAFYGDTSGEDFVYTPDMLYFTWEWAEEFIHEDGSRYEWFDDREYMIGDWPYNGEYPSFAEDYAGVETVFITGANIPDGLTGELVIPAEIDGKTVVGVARDAFKGCSKITRVTIEEGVLWVYPWAFSACSSLETVNIPHSMRFADGSAFNDCYSLTSFEMDNQDYTWEEIDRRFRRVLRVHDGVLYGMDDCFIVRYPSAKIDEDGVYEVREGTDSIYNYAFHGVQGLHTVYVPATVSEIRDAAFYLSSIANIDISVNCQWIDFSAFNYLLADEINIYIRNGYADERYNEEYDANDPERNEEAGIYKYHDIAFRDIDENKTVYVHGYAGSFWDEYISYLKTLTIDDKPYAQNINFVPFDDNDMNWATSTNSFYMYDDEGPLEDFDPETEVILVGYGKDVEDIVIPETIDGKTVVDIWWGFSICPKNNLRTVTFPDTFRHVQNWSLENNKNLIEVNLPSVNLDLNICVFSGCTSLETVNYWGDSISVWDAMTTIRDDGIKPTFNCYEGSVYMAEYTDINDWHSAENKPLSESRHFNYVEHPYPVSEVVFTYENAREYINANDLYWIDEEYIRGETNEGRWTKFDEEYPETPGSEPIMITGIASGMNPDFVIPSEIDGHPVVGVAERAFDYIRQIKNVTIEEGVIWLLGDAFNCCYGMETINFPHSMRIASSYGLSECINLREITVTNEDYTEEELERRNYHVLNTQDGVLFGNYYKALLRYPNARPSDGTYKIPDGTEWIETGAFNTVDTLTSVELPMTINSIHNAFGWSSINNFDIPASCTYISPSAFSPIKTDDPEINIIIRSEIMNENNVLNPDYDPNDPERNEESGVYKYWDIDIFRDMEDKTINIQAYAGSFWDEYISYLHTLNIDGRDYSNIHFIPFDEDNMNWATSSDPYYAEGPYIENFDPETETILLGYGKNTENVEVPSTINGKKVVEVWHDFFKPQKAEYNKIETLILPSTVRSVQGGSLDWVRNLREVTLSSSMTGMNVDTFDNVNSLETVNYWGDHLEIWDNNIIIREDGEKVTLNCFEGAVKLFEREDPANPDTEREIPLSESRHFNVVEQAREDITYGDVNNDGTINGKDVTLMRRYISGDIRESDTFIFSAADVNHDAVINGKDITLVRRYISGGFDIILGK